VTNSSWEFDGTQSPAPPPAFEDPAAGLVTGGSYEPDPLPMDFIQPVEPDLDEVRRAVNAQLAREELIGLSPMVPAPRAGEPTPADPPGVMPPNPRPGWPLKPAARQLANLRPPRPPKHRQIQRVRHQNRSSGRTIAGVAAVLAVVIVLLGIVVTIIGSFANTIATLFH
jgi:hypothetical protein